MSGFTRDPIERYQLVMAQLDGNLSMLRTQQGLIADAIDDLKSSLDHAATETHRKVLRQLDGTLITLRLQIESTTQTLEILQANWNPDEWQERTGSVRERVNELESQVLEIANHLRQLSRQKKEDPKTGITHELPGIPAREFADKLLKRGSKHDQIRTFADDIREVHAFALGDPLPRGFFLTNHSNVFALELYDQFVFFEVFDGSGVVEIRRDGPGLRSDDDPLCRDTKVLMDWCQIAIRTSRQLKGSRPAQYLSFAAIVGPREDKESHFDPPTHFVQYLQYDPKDPGFVDYDGDLNLWLKTHLVPGGSWTRERKADKHPLAFTLDEELYPYRSRYVTAPELNLSKPFLTLASLTRFLANHLEFKRLHILSVDVFEIYEAFRGEPIEGCYPTEREDIYWIRGGFFGRYSGYELRMAGRILELEPKESIEHQASLRMPPWGLLRKRSWTSKDQARAKESLVQARVMHKHSHFLPVLLFRDQQDEPEAWEFRSELFYPCEAGERHWVLSTLNPSTHAKESP